MFTLNRFREYIDPSSKEGISLMNAAIYDFKSPLQPEERIALDSKDGVRFRETIKRLSNQYGYDYLLKNVPSTRTSTPAADPGDPPTITYGGEINLLESYSAENISLCKKKASLVWGDESWTEQANQEIRALTAARGEISNHNPPRILEPGKTVNRDRTHSKFLAHQILSILTPEAQASIELEAEHYTWTSADGRDEEHDGLVVCALVMARVFPHYKVDMFAEVDKMRKIELKDFNFDLTKYFDKMKQQKILIDQKDRRAYTDDAYLRDLFRQLKEAPNESFRVEYENQETKWLTGKTTITPTQLMLEAQVHYTNLDKNNNWKPEHHPRSQIVALTTQLSAMQTQIEELKKAKSNSSGGGGSDGNGGDRGGGGGRGDLAFFRSTAFNPNNPEGKWRLTKVENGKQYGEITRDGHTFWFCDDGHKFDGKEVGMYCTHKPGEGHKKWAAKKGRGQRDKSPPNSSTPSSESDKEAKKLTLAKTLQSALVTKAGLSESQFQQIWDEACSESGN